MFNAALSFSGKAVSGVGIVISGVILKVVGMPSHVAPHDVSPDVIMRLGLAVGILMPLLYVIPMSLIRKLRITRKVHAEIRAALDRRALQPKPG